MIIDNPKSLKVILDRLLPNKFKGTTFEKIVGNMLENLSPQHQYIDHFTNRFDIEKIETDYTDEEIKTYTQQYLNILSNIMDIEYPTLVRNGKFTSGEDFWSLFSTSQLDWILPYSNSTTYTKGKVVQSQGLIYSCIVDTSTGVLPSGSSVDNSNWKYYKNYPIFSEGTIYSGNYVFNSMEKSFSFTKTTNDDNLVVKLEQNQIFGGDKSKFEVSFEIEDLPVSSNSYLNVYSGKSDGTNLIPSYTTYKNGKHSFRINFNLEERVTTGDTYKLIFEFNSNIKIKNVKVTEYERIEKDDLQVLAGQLIKNKGRLESYNFLFKLLTNLGSQGNLELAIQVDEFENVTNFTEPQVSVSEIFEPSVSNIKYGDTYTEDGTDYKYFFGRQDFYEIGHSFKDYIATYNTDKIVPFKYKVDATFDQDVFEEYILPIVHPAGWEIIYNVYKLVELVDVLEEFSEDYRGEYLDHIDMSNHGVEDKISKITELSSESSDIDVGTDTLIDQDDTIKSEVIDTDFGTDTLEEQDELDLSEYEDSLDMSNHGESDTLIDQDDTTKSEVIDTDFGTDTLIDQDDTDRTEVIDTDFGTDTLIDQDDTDRTEVIDTDYFDTLEEIDATDLSHIIEVEEFLTDSTDTSFDFYFGEDIVYDDGTDAVLYGDLQTTSLNNESISIETTIENHYTSEEVSSNLVQDQTVVLKVVNFGHGVENNFYFYKGVNSNSVNLTQMNFESVDWINLSNRVPA